MTTFPNLNKFGLKRELVVHLDVGVHVADVVVADQVHVTKLFISNSNQRKLPSTWCHVCLNI
jgi:hypothetical protein